MEMQEIVQSIKSDLGGDVISLGISDETIEMKIKESLRKVGSYAPKTVIENFVLDGEKVVLPEGTVVVQQVLSAGGSQSRTRVDNDGDIDIFDIGTYMNNSSTGTDAIEYLLRKSELESLMSFVEVTDWYYVPDTRTLFFNYYNSPSATIKYLKKYTDISEVQDDSLLDFVKNYAVALCKIIEGGIRRKFAQSPGALIMDGSEMVMEGRDEKITLEENMKKEFSNLRFGIRA